MFIFSGQINELSVFHELTFESTIPNNRILVILTLNLINFIKHFLIIKEHEKNLLREINAIIQNI